MATREARRGGSLGWFFIGILVGAVLVVGVYLYVTRAPSEPAPGPALPALPEAPVAGAAPSTPAAAAPPPVIVAPPAETTTAPRRVPSDEERQIADDAAATGMTGAYVAPEAAPAN